MPEASGSQRVLDRLGVDCHRVEPSVQFCGIAHLPSIISWCLPPKKFEAEEPGRI